MGLSLGLGVYNVKPSKIKSLIESRFKAGIQRALYIVGAPGLGKTEIPGQVAKDLGIGYKVIHAPLLQPEDYGFPVITGDRKNVDFVVSREKFPLEGTDCADKGLFLIDELPQADSSAQKILANLIQTKEIHGSRIKAGWSVLATGNRTVDRAGANRLLTHLKNRVTEVTLEVSLDDWTKWALGAGVKPEVVSFLRWKPDLLNAFDAQSEVNATPRAWCQGVSASLGVIDPSLELETFSGDVGEGPAATFLGFLRIYRKLPSPDAIMMNPTGTPMPDDSAVLYALCGALAHKTTEANFGRIMGFIERMPGEFQSLFIKDVIKLKPEVQTTADFIAWASTKGTEIFS
jgi:hypothetical protein